MASANINPRTQALHDVGQSLWLDNITRNLLSSGTLQRYIQDLAVTGLTSNPTIFDHAISKSTSYDDAIGHLRDTGIHATEDIFFRLAMDDLRRAADLFQPVYERTHGLDGFVSLEVSPLLAYDTAPTLAAAKDLFARAARANLFIKIPGTAAGLPAIEEAIFLGIPINVTLLFSARQYVAAAEAYTRGVERRIAAGLSPQVRSVASVFISRWDKAVMGKVPETLRNQLGLAVANYTYKAYRELLGADRWKKLMAAGAMPQRLLWASTGTKDPQAPDTFYISALAAPDTINTMPEETLLAFADHGTVAQVMTGDVGRSEEVVKEFAKVGFQVDVLAEQLQREGAASFVKSWNELMESVRVKGAKLAAGRT